MKIKSKNEAIPITLEKDNNNNVKISKDELNIGSLDDDICFLVEYDNYEEGYEFKIGKESALIVSNGDAGTENAINSMTKHVFYDQLNNRWHVVYIDNGNDIHTASSTDGNIWVNGVDIASGTYDYEDYDCIIDYDSSGIPSKTYLHCVYAPGSDHRLAYKRVNLTGSSPYISVPSSAEVPFSSPSFEGGDTNDDVSNPRIGQLSNDCMIAVFDLEDDSVLATADEHEIVLIAEDQGTTCGDGDWDLADMESKFPIFSVQSEAGYNYAVPLGMFEFPGGVRRDYQLLWVDTDSDTSADLETIFFNSSSSSFGTQDTLDADIEWGSLTSDGYTSIAGVGRANGEFLAFGLDDGTTDLDVWKLPNKGSTTATQTDTTLNMAYYQRGESLVTTVNDYEADIVHVFAVDSTDSKDIRRAEYDGTWTASDWENDITTETDEIFHMSSWFDNETCEIMVIWVNGTSTGVDLYAETYDTNCGSLLSDGSACSYGDQCENDTCIEGTCRSACSNTYDGDRCSDDTNVYTASASGQCARNFENKWSCDKDEQAHYSSDYYIDCYDIEKDNMPNAEYACDTDVDPSYSIEGVCTHNPFQMGDASCTVGAVCINGSSVYHGVLSYCAVDDECDSDVDVNGYIRNGLVCGSSCVVNGSLTEGETCCNNANCASDNCNASNECASSNTAPTISSIAVRDYTPIEAQNKTIYVLFNVTDADGSGDVDPTQASANITRNGVTRHSSDCVDYSSWTSGNNRGINCSIDMTYYDEPGHWNISVFANDTENEIATDENSTELTYNTLYAFTLSTSSISFGTVTGGSSGRVGGFAGINQLADAHISCCYADNVTVTGGDYVGGFVGYNYYYSLIEKCYATGNAFSSKNWCGGFAGVNIVYANIQNSFSRGNVTRTTGTGTYFGGFTGQNSRSSILRCYSTGSVSYTGAPNPTDKGFCGAIGYFQGGGECIWDIETSGQTSTADTLSTGKTTVEAQDILTYTSMLINWDIATKNNWVNEIWWIENGIGYPMIACCYVAPIPTARDKVISIHQDRNILGSSSECF